MANILIKVYTDDGLEEHPYPGWHLVDPARRQEQMLLCTGEVFGDMNSPLTYEIKKRERGGITCPHCLEMLKIYKKVKL